MTTTSRPPASQDPDASGSLRERSRRAVREQPAKTVTVLSSLLAAHDELRYLPYEAIDEVAQHTGSSVNEVWSVASFYPNFRFTPPARRQVEICWGPTCHVLGAQRILQGVAQSLELTGEGDTADGEISFKYNTCLGVCPHGPAMSFDHEVAGRMTLEDALRRIDLLRSGGGNSQERNA